NEMLVPEVCKDVPLEWGDVIELPETDHPLNEKWSGFNAAQLQAFKECLAREISVSVKGKETKILLAPQIDNTGYITTHLPYWLQFAEREGFSFPYPSRKLRFPARDI